MSFTVGTMTTHPAHKPVNFGRRNGARPVVSSRQAGSVSIRSGAASGPITFEARHAIRFNYVAFALLAAGGMTIKDLLDPATNGVFGANLSEFAQTLALVFAGAIVFIGLYWVYKSVSRSPAIRMTQSGITGYTFYGTKTVNWPDVERVSTTKDDNYGVVLEVYAKNNSPLGFIFKKGFAMPVGLTDSSLEEIAAAIRVHRPDLAIV